MFCYLVGCEWWVVNAPVVEVVVGSLDIPGSGDDGVLMVLL